MAGKIRVMIDTIIAEKTKGNHALLGVTRAKMTMKGIFPDKYTDTSEDDPVIIEKLYNLAKDLNVKI